MLNCILMNRCCIISICPLYCRVGIKLYSKIYSIFTIHTIKVWDCFWTFAIIENIIIYKVEIRRLPQCPIIKKWWNKSHHGCNIEDYLTLKWFFPKVKQKLYYTHTFIHCDLNNIKFYIHKKTSRQFYQNFICVNSACGVMDHY